MASWRAATSRMPVAKRLAGRLDPRQDALVLEDVEDRQRRGRRHRVAPERAEEHGLVGEPGGDLAARDDRGDRVAVAHRLAERDEVRADPEALERPHRVARPAVTALDLVGDPQPPAACVSRTSVGDVRGVEVVEAVARQDAVEDRRRGREASLSEPIDGRREDRRIIVRPAIGVRRRPRLDVRGRAAAEPALRRQRRARLRDAVVGTSRAQAAGVAGEGGRHPPGQVVRLGAGVDEQDRVEAVADTSPPGVRPARSPTRGGSACSC